MDSIKIIQGRIRECSLERMNKNSVILLLTIEDDYELYSYSVFATRKVANKLAEHKRTDGPIIIGLEQTDYNGKNTNWVNLFSRF